MRTLNPLMYLGLQKGAHSFVRATAMEALKLGTRLAVGTQVMLEQADDILRSEVKVNRAQRRASTDPMGSGLEGDGVMVEEGITDGANSTETGSGIEADLTTNDYTDLLYLQEEVEGTDEPVSISSTSKFSSPPSGLTEGLEQAYRSLSRNMGMAAHTIFAVPMEVYEQTGTSVSDALSTWMRLLDEEADSSFPLPLPHFLTFPLCVLYRVRRGLWSKRCL